MRALLQCLALLCILCAVGCGGYKDTYTPAGIPNFHVFAPGMYRTGLPPTPAAWAELRQLVEESGKRVVKVVLHDAAEGDESMALAYGWTLVLVPLPPEEDKPLTIFIKPRVEDVQTAVDTILRAHARGDITVWGCLHDRDRGGLVSMLIGMRLFGWTKEQALDYAIRTGMRWATPNLLEYIVADMAHRGASR